MHPNHAARTLKYAHEDLRNDDDVVAAAVSHRGRALEHAGPSARNNKLIVQQAVRQNGTALEFASPELQKDEELIALAKATGNVDDEDEDRNGFMHTLHTLFCRKKSLCLSVW